MINNHPPKNELTNDPLTDLFLHKDDETIIPDDGACWFPIHFSYQGIDYTADVLRTQTPLAEYHVTGVTPVMEYLPDPFVIAEHFSKEKFDFPVNETYYPLAFGNTVIRAISQETGNKFSLSPGNAE